MAERAPKPRILAADDAPENLAILGELLAEYACDGVLSGGEALAWLRAHPPPDLILLDVLMPGLDGFQVCQQLKADARLRDIPVIFITGLGDAASETRGFEAGAADYLTKPFNAAVVRARVRTQLALHTARQALTEQNTVLEERVAERTAQLTAALTRTKTASLETVLYLARAAEHRDTDTGTHVLRVSRYAALTARRVGWEPQAVEDLLYAAPMHDVGKIGIPDSILLKPGLLTATEWETMRQHTLIGARILAGSEAEVIRLAEAVALTHHERWDGAGYPRGLRGQEIPPAGRMVAIADVFDALTSHRPYREAVSVEQACAVLDAERGQHFDPDFCAAFLASQDEVLAIQARSRPSGALPWPGRPPCPPASVAPRGPASGG